MNPIESSSLIAKEGDAFVVEQASSKVFLTAEGDILFGGSSVAVTSMIDGSTAIKESSHITIDTPLLVRVVNTFQTSHSLTASVTTDLHRTGALHVYVRLTARCDTGDLHDLVIAAVSGLEEGVVEEKGGGVWAWSDSVGVGLNLKKFPWFARWNDVGPFAHRSLASSYCRFVAGQLRIGVEGASLLTGETIDVSFVLRAADNVDDIRSEGDYANIDEVRYVPEGEYRHQLAWEGDDVWYGPPITDGCPQRPYDQLITRPLGLNVLARKRFTWSNEDFSLWRLTRKSRYFEAGIKKAFALIETQNEFGGWYEGVEFYNLPPKHHQMYDTYISGMYLLDAYDATGYAGFLAAAKRACDFWCSAPPPANGHVEVAPGAWWYRWGGYINEFGYTDERCVLNTHSGATAFLALYSERTGDQEVRAAAARGLAAVRWGLERGIQRGDGQFLYSLSQVDPALSRPGDPPYITADLVPQIEDVYTVASSYRLLLANRLFRDEVIDSSIRKALDYWWKGYRAGEVYTYRAYATLGYAIAAGDLDLRYALALPEILRDPQHFTSMQRGLSSFVAPHGFGLVDVRVLGAVAAFVEPVFLRRSEGEVLIALVNVEQPIGQMRVRFELPRGATPISADQIDPSDSTMEERACRWSADDSVMEVLVDELKEFSVTALLIRFGEPNVD